MFLPDEQNPEAPSAASETEILQSEKTDSRAGLEGDRRKTDRRQSDRSGKYDRRKNRCGHCQFFQLKAGQQEGYCGFHNILVLTDTFACPHFQLAERS